MEAGLKKELIDQTAHFAAGLIATVSIGLVIGGLYAAVATMVFAILREIKQRLDRNDVWYGCSWGCRLDLAFWALGIGCGLLITIYLL